VSENNKVIGGVTGGLLGAAGGMLVGDVALAVGLIAVPAALPVLALIWLASGIAGAAA
jgi:hypothetical protein